MLCVAEKGWVLCVGEMRGRSRWTARAWVLTYAQTYVLREIKLSFVATQPRKMAERLTPIR